MAKHIAIALLVAGAALGLRGLFVWTACGYDCLALPFCSLTATGAILFGAIAAVAGTVALVAFILSRKSGPSR